MAKSPKTEFRVETYIEKIDNLITSDHNPRKIKRRDYEDLKQSLQEFPEMKQLREIIVDENKNILAGHQRLYALKDLDIEDVTVKQCFGLTEQQKRRFMALDNDHAGDWDMDIIANEWDTDDLKSWGIKSIKFPSMRDSDKEDVQFEAEKNKDVECPNCGFHFDPSEK